MIPCTRNQIFRHQCSLKPEELANNKQNNNTLSTKMFFCHQYRQSMNQKKLEQVKHIKLELQNLRSKIDAQSGEKLIKKLKVITKQLKKIQNYIGHLGDKQQIDYHQPTEVPNNSKQTSKQSSSDSVNDGSDSRNCEPFDKKILDSSEHNEVKSENEMRWELQWQLNNVVKLIKLKLTTTFISQNHFSWFNRLFEDRGDHQFDKVYSMVGSQSNEYAEANRYIQLNYQARMYRQNSFISQIIKNSNGETQTYYHQIHHNMTNLNQTLISQQFLDDEYPISNPTFYTMRCWCCITHLWKGSHLLQEDSPSKYKNFCIGEKDSRSIVEAEKVYDNLEELFCRVLNSGGGFIYFGIEQVKQKDSNTDKQSTGRNHLLQKFITSKKEQLVNSRRKKFVVQGVRLNCQTYAHKDKLNNMIKNYIRNHVGPEKFLLKVEVNTEYIPVLPNFQMFKQKKQEKGRYVIRVQVKCQANYRLFYVKLTNPKSLDGYYFYGQEEDLKELSKKCAAQNQSKIKKVYGSDIYEMMQKKYRNFTETLKRQNQEVEFDSSRMYGQYKKYGQNCNDCKYPIRCYSPLHLPDHEYNEQINYFDLFEKSTSNQTFFYYKNSNDYAKQAQAYKKALSALQNFCPESPSINLFKNLIPNCLSKPCDPTDYGTVPVTKDYKYSSIVIVSPKGVELNLFNKFIAQLNEGKIYFKLTSKPFDKLPKQSVREVYVINHEVKYEILNVIGRKIDHQKRNLVVLDTKKQMILMSSQNYNKAHLQLTHRFKNVFNAKFKYGMKDVSSMKGKGKIETQHFFAFQTYDQAIFAFILLEYNIIKCDFINQIKLTGLDLKQY